MSIYEPAAVGVLDEPGTGSVHPRNPFRKTRARLTAHFNDIISEIDGALLAGGWSSNRTSFATSAFDEALPGPASAAYPETPLALRTFDRVQDLLDLDDQQTAALVGISRNTPRDWRHGNQPRAATTRRLYELAGVLDLIATQQPDMAAWARGISPEGRTWLELAGEKDGPSAILGHLRSTLLTQRPPARLEVEADDEEEPQFEAAPAGPESRLVQRAGRRRRAR